MTETSHFNHELQLARDFVNCTDCNIFLTGKAGTGKTTFLHNLNKDMEKRMVITAPTGVAAISAGGVTLHSFFQLPFGPFLPGSDVYGTDKQRQFRFSKEKKQIIKSLDLLVIDEISMVRADLLDAVDAVLRRFRRSRYSFGQVQLLMIGDLHQLPPVVKPEEWNILENHYESAYFFSSKALQKTDFVPVELKHVYRQSDFEFIDLLNKVRDNRLDNNSLCSLNERYVEDFVPAEEQGYITLTTHNRSAETINQTRLNNLSSKEYCFQAKITGDFPEHIYPVPANLVLKEGAQVMFVRNDPSGEKLYYNGKIGQIKTVSKQEVKVVCPDQDQDIIVEPVIWENINYQVNEENKEIERKVIGTFEHYPLKLAWAITIHKSQGLTFEKAIIDAQAAFAHGQVYVALSRCKTLNGLVLSSPISPKGLKIDSSVNSFSREVRENPPSVNKLQAAKISYQQKLLLDCFDFTQTGRYLKIFVQSLLKNNKIIQISGYDDIRRLEKEAAEIFSVSKSFLSELGSLYCQDCLPEADNHIQERVSKGSAWFQDKLKSLLIDPLDSIQVETDNKELSKKIGQILDDLKMEMATKLAGLKSCANGFSASQYVRAVSVAKIDPAQVRQKKSQRTEYTDSDIAHPELFQILKEWRKRISREQNIAPYQVLHQRTLIQIAVNLPSNLSELKKIKGVGERTVEKCGQDLVSMVSTYCENYGIEQKVRTQPPASFSRMKSRDKVTPPTNTKERSLDMFKKGLTLDQIAVERGLALSTIEEHLSYFIEKGGLGINEVLSSAKQEAIAQVLTKGKTDTLRKLRDQLGNKYSYGQIKMVLAHHKYLNRE